MQKIASRVVTLSVLIASTAHAQAPVHWSVADGGNDHWYLIPSSTAAWPGANALAASMQGHLATIGSAYENAFVRGLTGANKIWIGGVQAASSCEPGCSWGWVTGEPWTYTNWATSVGEPNEATTGEDMINMLPDGRWNDSIPGVVRTMVIEWDADCNGDGIVDFGQIYAGQLDDLNNNYIPDICEAVTVPGDFATIQGAINAVPAGDFRLILVAPGIYAGPVRFDGKAVVVRGAGAGQTIIEGTGGATTSVVGFTGGEPTTAALEHFTVRGGETGTPFPLNPAMNFGGGVFSFTSAASLRDCTLEQNASGFGGGAYFWQSSGQIERCTFRSNIACTDGGGLQLYGGSVAVVDSILEQNYANSRGGGLSWVPQGTASALLTMTDCTVEGNSADKGSGGIGIVNDATVKTRIGSSTVCGNTPIPNIAGQWEDLGGNVVCDCAGDLLVDGQIDAVDLAVLLARWDTAGGAADINHSGLVDGADLAVLLVSYEVWNYATGETTTWQFWNT